MTMQVSEAFEIGPIDVRASSDEELRPVAEVVRALARERVAEDPDMPIAYLLRQLRATPDTIERWDWIARTGGAVVARAIAWRRRHGERQNVRNVEIDVLPGHRRRGLARAFLREIARGDADDASAMLGFITTDRIAAGETFLRRVGAEAGMTMTTNQLEVAAIDRALLAHWRESRPAGYRLERIDDDIPEHLLDNAVEAIGAMAATPTGTLRIWDFTATRETVRSFERARREQGREHLFLMAIDEATGRTAAFSEISWHPEQPHLIRQGGTATVAGHQGKGLGKWLKALLMEHVLQHHPHARYVRTNNNPVNAPIVAINERLGYRPAWTNTVWQLPVADARRYLASGSS